MILSTAKQFGSRGLHHVAYTTRDSEATYEFYSKKLGMPLLRTDNQRVGDGYVKHFFFGIGGDEAIAFFEVNGVGEEADFKTEVSTGLGLPLWANHVAFRLDSLEELERMKQRMEEHEIEAILELDHGWCSSVYMTDPNGIMVEFCVTTRADAFVEQSEEEALRLLRQPAEEILDETVKVVNSVMRG